MKTKFKIAIIPLTIAVVSAGVYLAQDTNAKYTTGGNGSDQARIAKWQIDNAEINMNLFSNEYTDADGENVTVKSHNSDNLIAPGTSGSKTIDFNDLDKLNKTEVGYQVKLNEMVVIDNQNVPLQYNLEFGTAEPTGWNNGTALKHFIYYSKPMKFDADGNPIGEHNNGKVTINWRWAYEYEDTDYKDTDLGTNFSDDFLNGINLDLKYSVTQTE
ncbi:MAG: hypothetical protein LBT80_09605 [Lactobacillaceae bacterium]|jgi:hypothetical protein|nr:hypothetical protein [Lactobacillaceae bacterium]